MIRNQLPFGEASPGDAAGYHRARPPASRKRRLCGRPDADRGRGQGGVRRGEGAGESLPDLCGDGVPAERDASPRDRAQGLVDRLCDGNFDDPSGQQARENVLLSGDDARAAAAGSCRPGLRKLPAWSLQLDVVKASLVDQNVAGHPGLVPISPAAMPVDRSV